MGQEKGRPLAPLPEGFTDRMEKMLGEEYPAFLKSYEEGRAYGLRVNLLKGSREELYGRLCRRFGLVPVPWCREGFYYGQEDRPGRHPFHQAGVYYIQEPSAMAVGSLLDPQPGEAVLDLCAAPGGKTTHIAARMAGEGLLVSNEVHPARAKALSQNVERMGAKNAVVTNEEPERLAKIFPGFFDRVVVDAPCSGEGMFRKEEQAREEWSRGHVQLCAGRQRQILDCGAKMLKPGGRMVYSTCTFSPEENEEVVIRFLESHPDFALVPAPGVLKGLSKGRLDWWGDQEELEGAYRIWPHKARGEGHFAALLEKKGEGPRARTRGGGGPERKKKGQNGNGKDEGLFSEFWAGTVPYISQEGFGLDPKRLAWFGGQLYHVPKGMPGLDGLRVLRPGLHLGTWKKNRLEPSHGLALALEPKHVGQCLRLDAEGPETAAYLAGNTLPAPEGRKGWVLVCADDYPLGWAKAAGGVLKNHYPKGLRV